jgi:alpha-amylase/alpha-mannosidase (GH57 family)
MSAKSALNVVLYWHMHQPEYRDCRSGNYRLPWTYLHIIKDYVDMAAHLEEHVNARAVVNFTPTLLEQIDDYAQQVKRYQHEGKGFSDPMLEALVNPALPQKAEQRLELIRQCLQANEERLIDRYPAYHSLAQMARWFREHPDTIIYVHDQFLVDLLMWFHLAWLGETVRRDDRRVKDLMKKASGYTLHDRIELLTVMGESITTVIERYRKLAEQGQVELSVTPYAHPIMPLLLDIKSTREAMPKAVLPNLTEYPGGEQRVRWHIEKGLQVFEHYFGFRPKGCWPSEGSVSEETVKLLGDYDFHWVASGESVLHNSLKKSADTASVEQNCIHRPFRYQDASPVCFFRDDGLSDLIGFTYSKWHADDAVANLVHHLENIAKVCKHQEQAVVSIILDGENAWEFYPENGYYFLDALYKSLSEHATINLTTYSEILAHKPEAFKLKHLVAGSWVYGTFSTWIGDADKNRGWDMLGDAKRAFDNVVDSGRLDASQKERAETQLAICEGSDWFWWFGDYNPADSVNDFDYLFRLQLSNLYLILGLEPPEYLTKSFTHGSGHPAMGGTMRRGQEQ